MGGWYHCFGFMTLGAVEKVQGHNRGGGDFCLDINPFFKLYNK